MLGQKNIIVIYVGSHQLEIFGHSASTSSILPLPPTIINNLEVVDRDGLYSLIATWAKTIPFVTTEIIWLLSPGVCFEQTLTDAQKDLWDTLTIQFLDSVPFEETLSRVYNPSGGRTIIATNQDFINALIQGFAVQGYLTRAVVTAKSLGVDSPLTVDSVKQITSNLSQILRDNLITPDASTTIEPKKDQTAKPKSSLPLLLGVFLTLLVILVFVIYLSK